MALKPKRTHLHSNIDYFMDEVAEAGGVVVASAVASGAFTDDSVAVVTYTTAPSGKLPVGVLMQDMVNLDLTRQHINFHKDEVQKGSKVCLWEKGVVVTDMIYPGQTPAVNKKAYLGPSGLLLAGPGNNPFSNPVVGDWKSSKDEDGYAEVSINLPQSTPVV